MGFLWAHVQNHVQLGRSQMAISEVQFQFQPGLPTSMQAQLQNLSSTSSCYKFIPLCPYKDARYCETKLEKDGQDVY